MLTRGTGSTVEGQDRAAADTDRWHDLLVRRRSGEQCLARDEGDRTSTPVGSMREQDHLLALDHICDILENAGMSIGPDA